MGSRIAAHLANARFPRCCSTSRRGCRAQASMPPLKSRPAAFFMPEAARPSLQAASTTISPKIKTATGSSRPLPKTSLSSARFTTRLIAHRTPGTIVSTNTSGIPLRADRGGLSGRIPEHFLGTHFFNPPRYLHLAELIPGAATRPEIIEQLAAFCDLHLGKGVVPCKDTPNFIANRIGAFFGATVHKLTVELDLTIEEVDALTGPLIGLPKSASYRLLDIVGLDVWAHVNGNLYEAVPHDPFRERFRKPALSRGDARARLARRKKRPGLLPARRRRARNSRRRLEDFRISSGAKAAFRFARKHPQGRTSGGSSPGAGSARRPPRPFPLAAAERPSFTRPTWCRRSRIA